MKNKNDFRVGDKAFFVVNGEVMAIGEDGKIMFKETERPLSFNEGGLFHGYGDGQAIETKPVRKVKIWVNLYANRNGAISAGFKYRNQKDCIDSAGGLLDATLIATAVEIELEE